MLDGQISAWYFGRQESPYHTQLQCDEVRRRGLYSQLSSSASRARIAARSARRRATCAASAFLISDQVMCCSSESETLRASARGPTAVVGPSAQGSAPTTPLPRGPKRYAATLLEARQGPPAFVGNAALVSFARRYAEGTAPGIPTVADVEGSQPGHRSAPRRRALPFLVGLPVGDDDQMGRPLVGAEVDGLGEASSQTSSGISFTTATAYVAAEAEGQAGTGCVSRRPTTTLRSASIFRPAGRAAVAHRTRLDHEEP